MSRSKLVAAFALVFCFATLTSGCFHRQLVRFQTHEQKPVVLMETLEVTDYWFWQDREHVFWSCAETDSTLDCSRRCGADSGLDCPMVEVFGHQVGTNVR